ncbi:MAG: hypothetical protein E7812_11810 [Phenylobacterium sp.]|nr:MAG: hypothetical protein E7812_11810 [Phenylobacterium sp.]
MSATTFDGTYAVDPVRVDRTTPMGPTQGYVGERAFIWVTWAAAFGFWALTMSSFFGILRVIFGL